MLKPTLMRLIDFLKQRSITALFTSLIAEAAPRRSRDSQIGVSSLMDTWLLLREHRAQRRAQRARCRC